MKRSSCIATSSVIAALYAALTLITSPVSFGMIQLRVSEVLTVLSLFSPAAVPGLAAGCFIANMIGPNGIVDAVLGTAATLAGCLGMRALRHHPYLAPAVNVVVNAVVIGLELAYVITPGVPPVLCMMWVGGGELLSCWLLGIPLIRFLEKRGKELGL